MSAGGTPLPNERLLSGRVDSWRSRCPACGRPFRTSPPAPAPSAPAGPSQNLKDAFLGRSHRAKGGKAKLKRAIEETRAVLEVPGRLPDRHRAGLRHRRGRDGDVVDAGRAPRHHDRVGILRRRLDHRRRQAAQAEGRDQHQGALRQASRPLQGRSEIRHRVHLERHDLGRAREERRLDQRPTAKASRSATRPRRRSRSRSTGQSSMSSPSRGRRRSAARRRTAC